MKATNSISRKVELQLEVYRDKLKEVHKFSEAPVCTSDPFISMLGDVIEVKTKQIGGKKAIADVSIINDETGVVTAGYEAKAFYEKKYVDNDKFIKLYQGQLKAMFALSGAAIKVFGYFIHEIQGIDGMNRDTAYFNIQDCMDFCQYGSHGQVYNGLIELIKKEFIAISSRANFFYVNPMYAFNGNRVLIYQEFIRKDGLTKAGEQHKLENNERQENDF